MSRLPRIGQLLGKRELQAPIFIDRDVKVIDIHLVSLLML